MIIHLTKLIPELLYQHNCVIIPGFGGFVATSVPSHLQEDRSTIHPPSKRIAFNQNLRDNDGLLGVALSKKLLISYDQALNLLQEEISYLRIHLEKYRNFEFKHTGTFYLNVENQLLFVPYLNQNFLIESYGFSPVKVRPILKETSRQTHQKQTRKTPVREKSVNPLETNTRRKNRIGWFPAIAASITLLATAAFVLTEWYKSEKTPGNHSMAGVSILPDSQLIGPSDLELIDELFPAAEKIPSNTAEVVTNTPESGSPDKEKEIKSELEHKIQTSKNVIPLKKESTPALEVTIPKENVKPAASISHQTAFAVICMQTRDKKVARQMLQRLQKRQYEAGIFEQVKPGWHLVYAQSLYTREAAQMFAEMVKENEGLDTEILEHIIP